MNKCRYAILAAVFLASCSSSQGSLSSISSSVAPLISSSPSSSSLTSFESSSEQVPTFYTVHFDLSYDGLGFDIQVESGQRIDQPIDPERTGYDFAGWVTNDGLVFDFEHAFAQQDLTLYASWERVSYEVRFQNDDGSLLCLQSGYYGEEVTYQGQEPVPSALEEGYGYVFLGWDQELIVLGDMTFTAVYELYLLPKFARFYDYDGTTLLYETPITEGSAPKYEGDPPTRAEDLNQGIGYVFEGWEALEDGLTYVASYMPYSLGLEILKGVVANYQGQAEEIIIPSVWEGTYVTSIGERAFTGNASIKSVSLPSSLTHIGKEAFYGCTSLESLVLPEGVEALEENALALCDAFTGILLPRSLKRIETGVFANDYSMVTILYAGSQEEWESVELAADPGYGFYWSTLYFFSSEPRYDGPYWWYEEGEIVTYKP